MKFNPLEKRAFMLFLGLYLFSAFFFVTSVAFWYYEAQKKSLESTTFMQLQHIADTIAGDIIVSYMQGEPMPPITQTHSAKIELITDTNRSLTPGYRIGKEEVVLISDSAKSHHGVRFIVIRSKLYHQKLYTLKKEVITFALISAVMITLIAWILSRLFMLPLQKRVAQIERFVADITHELNTPISSLKIATKQLKDGSCNQEKVGFIEISTKQLFDIYRSLSYLNFHRATPNKEQVNITKVLLESISYYTPLADSKKITIDTKLAIDEMQKRINAEELMLLFGNLISNAIKYSPRGAHILIETKGNRITIADEGIGIDQNKIASIFEKFERATKMGGGFGIGLSVVKRICETYRIKLDLVSKKKMGTIVILDFSEVNS